jgi:transaldolase
MVVNTKGQWNMSIFLDTADLKEIKRYHRMGIISGVTTNPTILLNEGLRGGVRVIEPHAKELASLVAPLPVSLEVTSNEPRQILEQAEMFETWADNIVVKIPIHGPQGEMENLEIIHDLETRHNLRVNVTAMMSAQQCFIAALAGASYVSIFGGRINNMGYNACTEISRLRHLLDRSCLKSQIIVGSTREVLNIIEWLEAGAHIVTAGPSFLAGMIIHPYTKETVQMFLHDAAASL